MSRSGRIQLPRFRIRAKLIGILTIAAGLPLCIALAAAQLVGYRYYRQAQGILFENRAQEIAHGLNAGVSRQIENLRNWTRLFALAERLNARTLHGEGEQTWASLSAPASFSGPSLRSTLGDELQAFQRVHPLFVELMVTNAEGMIVAATRGPSNDWQGGAAWWKNTLKLQEGAIYLEGIHYDPGTRLYSIHIALPLYAGNGSEPPMGTLQVVLNVSPLLAAIRPPNHGLPAVQEFIFGDGRILARIFGPQMTPLHEQIAPEVAATIAGAGEGWMMASLQGGSAVEVIGYAPVNLSAMEDERRLVGATPMFILVHDKADFVLAPMRHQIFMVGAVGAVIVLGCALGGYYIATRKIIAPIEVLRVSTQAIAASAKLDGASLAPSCTIPALAQLQGIATGDELEILARDFAYMAGRVLTYHDQLEAEIRLKTSEIESDLQIAREFQEALLPHAYPQVPSDGHDDPVRLIFQHIYRPASSVGGDFFDVLKLSDHCAGIFIADVMGHGARSALVTAILRALLHNLIFKTTDPSEFLHELNRHFHDIIRDSSEIIFVSAFYLIVDTQTSTASYGSAGHPSPFVANRQGKEVVPLISNLRGNPALGLFPDSVYSKWNRPVHAGDIFLLFTDGVHEAYNLEGEEFGAERIREVIRTQLRRNGNQLSREVVQAVDRFIAPAMPADDICLVSVEVSPAFLSGESV